MDLPLTAARDRPTLIVGVLGGIASGKTAAARAIAGPEGRVVDADRLAGEELASAEGRARLCERFGAQALGADGLPDRAFLARAVFADPRERAWLEGWIHPRVRAKIAAEIESSLAARVPRLVLDVPLLLENESSHGLAARCDALVFVETDLAQRRACAAAARGWQAGELERREALQMPLAAKRARADLVIENRAGLAELEAAALEARRALELRRRGAQRPQTRP